MYSKGVREGEVQKKNEPGTLQEQTPLMRQEGAAVRLASCCPNLKNE